MKHYSVLKSEALASLCLKPDSIIVDATLGYGGHASEILKQIPNGHLYAFDLDEEAILYSQKRLQQIGSNFTIIHANYREMKEKLAQYSVSKVDGILFDLGVSSPQIDDAKRGFSFMQDEKLDMRMDQSQELDAKKVINSYSEEALCDIFFHYGEEKKSKLIAKKIVAKRKEKSILRTLELVEVIKEAVGANYFYKYHPERTIFQAIRIEVNEELKSLHQVLPDAISLLKKEGRLCVITFHSLEDRIVKQVFRSACEVDEVVKNIPNVPLMYQPKMKLVYKKPLVASEEELKENRRSKSAKLRVIERVMEDGQEE